MAPEAAAAGAAVTLRSAEMAEVAPGTRAQVAHGRAASNGQGDRVREPGSGLVTGSSKVAGSGRATSSERSDGPTRGPWP
ncbi:hypothetical protein AYJ66_03670 [Dietzia cinnamea]|nr:hypothetical protein AYJ66_03670 [Dietzia cinnamea]